MDDVEIKGAGDPAAGKGLFATKDFAPGDAVVSLPRPWLAELDNQYMHGAADPPGPRYNLARGPPSGLSVSACSRCKHARYCSKECQTKAWKREHKYECKILSNPAISRLPNICRATIKLVGQIQARADNDTDEPISHLLSFPPYAVHQIETPDRLAQLKANDPERFEDLCILAQGVWKYCGEPKIKNVQDPRGIVTAMFMNIAFNNFQLGDPLNSADLGIGFDLTLCRANHSCDPNAVLVFSQPKVFLRALRPIKQGEEVFIKYTDISNPRSVRRDHVKRGYLFDCHCSRCELGMESITDKFIKPPEQLAAPFIKAADTLLKRHQEHLGRHEEPAIADPVARKRVAALQAEAFSVAENDDVDDDEELRDALKLCLNSGLWPTHRQPVPHLLRQRFVFALATGRSYAAWRIGIKNYLQNTVLHCPQPFHPDRMVDGWALSMVTQTMCTPGHPSYSAEVLKEAHNAGLDLDVVAIGFMLEVYDNIDRSYGRASPFGRAVTIAYDQLASSPGASVAFFRQKVKEMWPKLEVVAKSVDILGL